MNRIGFYFTGRVVTIILCALFFTIMLHGQETDTSITISHFMYPDIEGIPIILDEGGENSFFLNTHYPRMLNDYLINHVMVDGSLHLPQGSYFLPALLPKGASSDSIHNYSQIHYRRGDFDSGNLGIALQIEGDDSSYFTLQGFTQSPPVLYSNSSLNDNLQNYLISYEHMAEDALISVDVLYHLEEYHLPLESGIEYKREVESFHGGFGLEKKWGNLYIDFHPAFQLTHANRQGEQATYFTAWNRFSSKLGLWNHFNLSVEQKSKKMIAEKNSQLTENEIHIVRPKLQYNSGAIIMEGGAALYSGLIKPEGKVSWRYKHLYASAGREFHIYFEPTQMAEYEQIQYSLLSLNIGYISNILNVILDIFQVTHSDGDKPGFREEIEMDFSWLRLSQEAGVYNIKRDDVGPLDMFNHLSVLFSPNIWNWRTARFQPFIGLESFYLQHSGKTGINPTVIPVVQNLSPEMQPYNSHLLNMEFGFLVNRFKVSYRWIRFNILGDKVQNSSRTYPIIPVRQLEVVWQFLN